MFAHHVTTFAFSFHVALIKKDKLGIKKGVKIISNMWFLLAPNFPTTFIEVACY